MMTFNDLRIEAGDMAKFSEWYGERKPDDRSDIRFGPDSKLARALAERLEQRLAERGTG